MKEVLMYTAVLLIIPLIMLALFAGTLIPVFIIIPLLIIAFGNRFKL